MDSTTWDEEEMYEEDMFDIAPFRKKKSKVPGVLMFSGVLIIILAVVLVVMKPMIVGAKDIIPFAGGEEEPEINVSVGDGVDGESLRRVVTLGDSTVALGDGYERGLSRSGCLIEHGTWSTMIPGSVEEWSCTGATSLEMRDSIVGADHSPEVDTVYVTVGSNDFRKGGDHVGLITDLEALRHEMVMTWGDADIVWVGYLPVPESECHDDAEREYAHYLHVRHVKADNAMREIASVHRDRFVDVSFAEFDMCGEGTFIHTPGSDLGMEWHTTVDGHRFIADEIAKGGRLV